MNFKKKSICKCRACSRFLSHFGNLHCVSEPPHAFCMFLSPCLISTSLCTYFVCYWRLAMFFSSGEHACQRAPVWTCSHLKGKSLSHLQLCATPWTVAHQTPLSMGILQARILGPVAIPVSITLNQCYCHHRESI